MPKERIIVTGGAGFIGSHLVDELIRRKNTVIVIDKKECDPAYKNKSADYCLTDITDLRRIKDIFSFYGPDFVFHCAAMARIQQSIDFPVNSFETNCRGTLNILLTSKEVKVERVIYSASSSAYGYQPSLPLDESMKTNPLNPYALYKYFGEGLCKVFSGIYGLETVSLRYFNVYGPRQPLEGPYSTVIPKFLDQWKRKEPITIIPDGYQSRDFTYITDVVEANILAMNSFGVGKGEVINIGRGKDITMFELKDIIGGRNYPWKFIKPRLGEVKATRADIKNAKILLNWEPKVSIEEGINIMKSIV